MVGRHAGEEDEAKPRNWARIGCANANNKVTHTKKFRKFLLHTGHCLLDTTGRNLRIFGQGVCSIFLRSRSQAKQFGWVASSLAAQFVCFHGSFLLVLVRRPHLTDALTHPHLTSAPVQRDTWVGEIWVARDFATSQKSRRYFGGTDGRYQMTTVTRLLIRTRISHRRTQRRGKDRTEDPDGRFQEV